MKNSSKGIMGKVCGVSGAILISRILGLFRVRLEAEVLGGGAVASAWHFAFTFPNVLRRLFGEDGLSKYRFLQDGRRLRAITFLLFFIPGTPKDILTYFVGLTKMTLSEFLSITLIARIPSVLSSTISGQMLGDENFMTAGIVYAVTGALSIGGYILYNRLVQNRQHHND